MQDAFRHCEDLIRAADKDRYLATLFAPAERRGALFALYAFDVEIARIADAVREPMAGEIRLQWWRDVLNRERDGEAAANPVAAALLDTVARHALPAQRLADLLEARAFDLYSDPMPTFDALEGYARRTSATIFDLAARICGASAENASEQAGLAYGLTGVLRTFARDASRRRLHVPLEALEGGTTPEEIFAGQGAPSLVSALGMVRSRVRAHLEAFEAALPRVSAAAAPAFLPVALIPADLARMERRDYDPFRTVIEGPQWRRQWTLWRASKRYSSRMI